MTNQVSIPAVAGRGNTDINFNPNGTFRPGAFDPCIPLDQRRPHPFAGSGLIPRLSMGSTATMLDALVLSEQADKLVVLDTDTVEEAKRKYDEFDRLRVANGVAPRTGRRNAELRENRLNELRKLHAKGAAPTMEVQTAINVLNNIIANAQAELAKLTALL